MKNAYRARRRLHWAWVAALLSSAAVMGARRGDSPLREECESAMSAMITAMHAPSRGDDDADFAALMIAHHEGAIAMAKAELRHGKHEQLRRLAQEMIITQQQEIIAMRLAAGGRAATRDSPDAARADAPR